MSVEEFIKEMSNLGVNITPKIINQLNIYKEMLQEYNKKFNLTSITNDNDIYLKHFFDSLSIIKIIDLKKKLKLLDIGTGAGFPGLVLKIVFPHLDITLLDSNNKKINFLNDVIKELDLTGVMCINIRAEKLNREYIEYFDVVTSRAVAHLRILTELALPYLKINGYFIPLKGNLDEELKESLSTIKCLNSEIEEQIKFILPIENSNRTILKIVKKGKTNIIYPRSFNEIKNKKL